MKSTTILAALTLAACCLTTLAQRPTGQAYAVDPARVTGDLIDPSRSHDGRPDTRATSGGRDYTGMSLVIDLGREHPIISVVQDHGRWPTEYPGAYRIEVGASTRGPWLTTFEGSGRRGESQSFFNAVRGRFVRITATSTRGGGNQWSVAGLKVLVDPGQTGRPIPPEGVPDGERSQRGSGIRGDLRDLSNAIDRDLNTRATSGTANYSRMSLVWDLGAEYEISRVAQVHGQWPEDYPREYRIEVSRRPDDRQFREVWRGAGERGRSVARFNPVTARYIRVTALRNRDRFHWWSIAEIRSNRDPDSGEDEIEDDRRANREIRRASAQGISNINAAIGSDSRARATSETANYAGGWILLDLGTSQVVSRVLQVHDPDENDYPARYRIEVSQDGNRWQTAWQGPGERGRSSAVFSPVRARYVRITAVSNRDNRHWWSIYTLRVRG